ncbi:MAG: hypothetical protein NXI11_00800 [Proteobacteria bacterium]|nr:hypothetical protein [Pseudomonadota bacterium]
MQTIELIRGHKHRGVYCKAGEQLTVTETVARRLVMRGKAKAAEGAQKAPAKKAPKKAAAKKVTTESNPES